MGSPTVRAATIAFAALLPPDEDGVGVLDDRWVDPLYPGFYEATGAEQARAAVGSWGRELPVLRLELG